jgi:hypothetical protein
MSKHANDSPDVYIAFDRAAKEWVFGYDCVGLCKFALCETMPPEDDSVCCFNNGGCTNVSAQIARLKSAKKAISDKIKGGEDE